MIILPILYLMHLNELFLLQGTVVQHVQMDWKVRQAIVGQLLKLLLQVTQYVVVHPEQIQCLLLHQVMA